MIIFLLEIVVSFEFSINKTMIIKSQIIMFSPPSHHLQNKFIIIHLSTKKYKILINLYYIRIFYIFKVI